MTTLLLASPKMVESRRTSNAGGEQVLPLEGVHGGQGFEGPVVVPHQAVHAQQAQQAIVPQHPQHIAALGLIPIRLCQPLL